MSDETLLPRVTAALTHAYAAGQRAERERCALIAWRHHLDPEDDDESSFCSCGKDIAETIRAPESA